MVTVFSFILELFFHNLILYSNFVSSGYDKSSDIINSLSVICSLFCSDVQNNVIC